MILSKLKTYALAAAGIAIAALAALAKILSGQKAAAKREAKHQAERAQDAETARDTLHAVNNARQELAAKQREERQQTGAGLEAGKRDQLDEEWK